LGLSGATHKSSLFEDLDVLRDCLFGDLEWLGQLVDRGRAPAEAGDDPTPYRIGQGSKRPVETVAGRRIISDH
jgi:hypothetical protein